MSLSRAIRRAGTLAGVAVLAGGGTALPANAADFVFPSCPGFDIGLTPLTSHGNPVQAGPRAVVAAGSGTSTLDNETTGATITFRGAGAFNAEETPTAPLPSPPRDERSCSCSTRTRVGPRPPCTQGGS
jgi:hypothetical protein